MTTIPLRYAKLCADDACDTLFDAREFRECPQCGFALAVYISRWLNGRPTATAHR